MGPLLISHLIPKGRFEGKTWERGGGKGGPSAEVQRKRGGIQGLHEGWYESSRVHSDTSTVTRERRLHTRTPVYPGTNIQLCPCVTDRGYYCSGAVEWSRYRVPSITTQNGGVSQCRGLE